MEKTQEMINWEAEHSPQMCLANFEEDVTWDTPGIKSGCSEYRRYKREKDKEK